MSVYLVQKAVLEQRGVERERFEVTRDGEYITGVDKPRQSTMDAWRAAVRMLRANLARRFDETAPIFAAHSDDEECVAFAEMLNV